MAVKVYLENAYERLRWDFIQDPLEDASFPNSVINVIMYCINTTSMQVLWNDAMTEAFFLIEGVRQGDPLSPYLFVLTMERLRHLIDMVVENKN